MIITSGWTFFYNFCKSHNQAVSNIIFFIPIFFSMRRKTLTRSTTYHDRWLAAIISDFCQKFIKFSVFKSQSSNIFVNNGRAEVMTVCCCRYFVNIATSKHFYCWKHSIEQQIPKKSHRRQRKKSIS